MLHLADEVAAAASAVRRRLGARVVVAWKHAAPGLPAAAGPIFLALNQIGFFGGRLPPFSAAAALFGYFWVSAAACRSG